MRPQSYCTLFFINARHIKVVVPYDVFVPLVLHIRKQGISFDNQPGSHAIIQNCFALGFMSWGACCMGAFFCYSCPRLGNTEYYHWHCHELGALESPSKIWH